MRLKQTGKEEILTVIVSITIEIRNTSFADRNLGVGALRTADAG